MTGAAFSAASSLLADSTAEAVEKRGILVRFLGTGASGWHPSSAKRKYARRQSSILIENKIVIDFTMCGFDHFPKEITPKALFVTHSHGDHFNALAVVKLGVKKVYTHSSWSKHAKTVLDMAAQEAKVSSPEVIGIEFASPIEIDGIKVTAVLLRHNVGNIFCFRATVIHTHLRTMMHVNIRLCRSVSKVGEVLFLHLKFKAQTGQEGFYLVEFTL